MLILITINSLAIIRIHITKRVLDIRLIGYEKCQAPNERQVHAASSKFQGLRVHTKG